MTARIPTAHITIYFFKLATKATSYRPLLVVSGTTGTLTLLLVQAKNEERHQCGRTVKLLFVLAVDVHLSFRE